MRTTANVGRYEPGAGRKTVASAYEQCASVEQKKKFCENKSIIEECALLARPMRIGWRTLMEWVGVFNWFTLSARGYLIIVAWTFFFRLTCVFDEIAFRCNWLRTQILAAKKNRIDIEIESRIHFQFSIGIPHGKIDWFRFDFRGQPLLISIMNDRSESRFATRHKI